MNGIISDREREQIVRSCRTTIGDELRHVGYVTDDHRESLYTRDDVPRHVDSDVAVPSHNRDAGRISLRDSGAMYITERAFNAYQECREYDLQKRERIRGVARSNLNDPGSSAPSSTGVRTRTSTSWTTCSTPPRSAMSASSCSKEPVWNRRSSRQVWTDFTLLAIYRRDDSVAVVD